MKSIMSILAIFIGLSVCNAFGQVDTPDLQVTEVTISGDAWSGRKIFVNWTVSNKGTGKAPGGWEDNVYISTDNQVGNDTPLATFRREDDLNVGKSYSFSRPVTLPDVVEGERWIIVTTDWANQVDEHEAENNNSRVSDELIVRMIPCPDLAVDSVDVPIEVCAEHSLSVSWTVKNIGKGATDASFWYDYVYLSIDKTFDGFDTYLGQIINASYLDTGEGYVQNEEFTIPREIAGPYYVLVMTDNKGNVRECNDAGNAENNNWGSSKTQVDVKPCNADLQVTRVQVTTTGIVFSGYEISVTWEVTNRGSTRTDGSPWSDTLYLSNDTQLSTKDDFRLETFKYEGVLNAGASDTRTENVTLPADRWGKHYICVLADSGDQIYEQPWENNNSACDNQPIDIILPPPADLEASSISILTPEVSSAGNLLTLEWTVVNNGGHPTKVSSWNDSVYLSTDETLKPESDTLLGSFSHSGVLETGKSYTESRDVTLPKAIQGAYHLIVWADSGNAAFESDWENNNTRSTPIQIQIADLEVSAVSVPEKGSSGNPIDINWTVFNIGDGVTDVDTWNDNVYLSADKTLEPDSDILLRQFPHSGRINSGESYAQNSTVILPPDKKGRYYLIVWTDSENTVFESDWENNNTRSTPIQIQIANLEVSAVNAPMKGLSGDSIPINWTVSNIGDGATDVDTWNDSIYLSMDKTLEPDSDIILSQFPHSGRIEAGKDYVQNEQNEKNVPLPRGIKGIHYLIVWTDSENSVLESNDNNNTRRTSIQIYVADLEVYEFNAPTDGVSGNPIAINWTVSNCSTGETDVDEWNDSIYLSVDETLEPKSDILLRQIPHKGKLGTCEKYTQNSTVILPCGIKGVRYLIVWTDSPPVDGREAGGAVSEADENNNISTALPHIQVIRNQADLQVIGVTTEEIIAGKSIQVQWTVTNAGVDSTGVASWKDGLYLSRDQKFQPTTDILLGMFPHDGELAPGAQYTSSESVTAPLNADGEYYVLVNVDAENDVDEKNAEANNTKSSLEKVNIISPLPDLQVTMVDAPETGIAGRIISVSWTVANTGRSPNAASSWVDDVFLSSDDKLNISSDTRLGRFTHHDGLLKDGFYSNTQDLKLPQVISGNLYVFVRTDAGGKENESLEDNNIAFDSTPVNVTFAPADLQVNNIGVPDTGISGQPITVEWMVENQGVGETDVSQWYDTLYFSRDSFKDDTDQNLGYLARNRSLLAKDNYTQNMEVSLPPGSSGPAYIIVFTDSDNQVFEHSNENNNVKISNVIQVIFAPLADLVVSQIDAPASGVPGQPSLISWTVTNQGSSDAVGQWSDSVYLSTDRTWDIGDAFVGDVEHQGIVGPEENYTGSINTVLPGVVTGDYYVIVRTDIRNQVRENKENNNVGVSVNPILMDVMELTLGVPYTSQLSTGAEHYYKVTVPAGEDLLITLDSASTISANELYVRYGAMPSRAQHDFIYDKPFEPDQEITVPTTLAGDYYILVRGDYVPDAPAAYAITAELLQFLIRSITPNYGGNTGKVTVSITGASFDSGISVKLSREGFSDIPAIEVRFINSALIWARFDLTDTAEGRWDVVVTRQDSTETSLPGAFRIEPGREPEIETTLYGPDSIRSGRSGTLHFIVRNNSNVDAERILVRITAPFYNQLLIESRTSQPYQEETVEYPNEDGQWETTLVTGDLPPGESTRPLDIVLQPQRGYPEADVPVNIQSVVLTREEFEAELYAKVEEQAMRAAQADDIDEMHREYLEDRRRWREETIPELLDLIGDQIADQYGWTLVRGGIVGVICVLQPELCPFAVGGLIIYEVWNLWHGVINRMERIYENHTRPMVVRPIDPNEKKGPEFSGPEGFVTINQLLPYTVYFENVPDATAPAEQVSITDQLDPDLDWRAFRLGEIAFGDTVVTVPENRSVHQTRLALESGMFLDITAGVDITTGEASWLFRTIDPATGEPPIDPSLGFLPPNDENHIGEGHVTYTIKPRADLAGGTKITNKATIVFDKNEAIETNEVVNTIYSESLPDLIPLSVNVQSELPKPIEGEPLTITATIENDSAVNVSRFNVDFFNGNPNAGGNQIGSAQVDNLIAQDTQTVQVTWTPTRLLKCDIYVKVDPEDAVSEINEQNNVSSPSPVVFKPRSFTVHLAEGINMFALPLEPETPYTARSLAMKLDAKMISRPIVNHNSTTGTCKLFLPENFISDEFPIEGSKGYIVIMKEAKSVTFEGISHPGEVKVQPCADILSLPLQPPLPYTARLFAKKLGTGGVCRFNTDTQKLEWFLLSDEGDGFEIEGGKSYIVLGTKEQTVTFTGKGWMDSTQPPAAALLASSTAQFDGNTSSIFGVVGYIYRDDGKTPVSKAYTVVITDKRNGAQISTTVDERSGQYAGMFIDISNQQPISGGDKLEVIVKDSDNKIVGGPVVYTVTPDDIKNVYATFNASLTRLIPTKNMLAQNFPNPFNPDTWIPYQLSKDADVAINIYNLAGQLVRTLELGQKPAGYYMEKEKAAHWNGRNDAGEQVASGLYFYTIKTDKFIAIKKMVILK